MAEEKEDGLFNWANEEDISFTAFEEEVNTPITEDASEEDDKGEGAKTEDVDAIFAELTNPDSEEVEESEEESEEEEEREEVDMISLLKSMKDNKLIDYELEDGQELTPELAKEFIDGDTEDKVLAKVDTLLSELPEDVKNLNKYILNGGTLQDYIKSTEAENKILSRSMDVEDPANQALIVRSKLEKEGFDDEYITDQLAYLTEKGMLKSTASKHFENWSHEEAQKEEALLARKREDIENRKQEKKALKKKVQDFVTDNKEIGGFTFSEEDRKELPGYMTEESVVLENGRKMTPFQRDVLASLADEKKAMLIAKLAKSNFDFTSLKESIITEKTGEVKEKLRHTKNSTPSSSTRSGSQKKSLADHF